MRINNFASRYALISLLVASCLLTTPRAILSNAVRASRPTPNGTTRKLSPAIGAPELTGIWLGMGEMFSGLTLFNPTFELRLQDTDGKITGKVKLWYGNGDASFDVLGDFDGEHFVGHTTNYQLVQKFTQDRNRQIFNSCKQLTFDMSRKYGSVAQNFNYPKAQRFPSETDYVGDVLVGEIDGDNPGCSSAFGSSIGLIRHPQAIVAIFGGFNDEGWAGSDVVGIGVFKRYVDELKRASQVNQSVQYFQHDYDLSAKKFIYRELRAAPRAKLAIVGHSMGGNATFRLAKDIQKDFPELVIDLVVTLDPVTQTPHDVNHERKGMGRKSAVPKVAEIPPRPSNVKEWINVYVEHELRYDWIAMLGGKPWDRQTAADLNLLVPGAHHGDASDMFFNVTNGVCPADKVKAVRPVGVIMPYPELLQKLALLADSSYAPTSKFEDIEPSSGGPGEQIPNSEGASMFQVATSLATSFALKRGDKVKINASGRIVVGPFAGASGPDGITGFEDYSYFPEAPHGSLLVRIKQNGDEQWMLCGRSCSLTAQVNGTLEFMVNDEDFANNSGAYKVAVVRTR